MSHTVYTYTTIRSTSEGRFQSRGSKFIAYLYPIETLEHFNDLVNTLKPDHPKARHFCTGYRILDANGIPMEHGSDDGEPSGSAGAPILSALKSHDLMHVGCVVVRYFGGTKLGVPGLIEAYRTSADEAVENAELLTSIRTVKMRVVAPIALQPHIMHQIGLRNLSFDNAIYTDRVSIDIEIPLENKDQQLRQLLKDLSQHDYDSIESYLEYLDMQISEID